MKSSPFVLAAVVFGLLSSCASSDALRMSLDEREAEIRRLRDEKVALKAELERVGYDRDQLQAALSEASMRVEPAPTAAPALQYGELEAQGITATRRGGDVVFNIPSAVTFASGRAALSDSGKDALRALAKRLDSDFSSAADFHIEGHTDSDPISKSKFASNRELSLARAMAVLNFLVVECRIEDERFVVAGHGQYEPLASNDSREGKARNRRVEIVVRE